MRVNDESSLHAAATVLVSSALRVAPGERFVVVGDESTIPLLTALETAGREAGAEVAALRLDQLRSVSTNHPGDRPHRVLPDGVRRAMLAAQASVFVASAPDAETGMRDQLLHAAWACRVRHAHMPGTSLAAFAAGFATDYRELEARGLRVARVLEGGTSLRLESAGGTDLVVEAPRNGRWMPRLGHVESGEAVLLPAGSLAAVPETVSGTFVADASISGYPGVLPAPLRFEIAGGKVVRVTSDGPADILRTVEQKLASGPEHDRVGLVVVGLNEGIGAPLGDASVDQHRPGVHLGMGPFAAKAATNAAAGRLPMFACSADTTVMLDGTLVVDRGRVALT